MKIKQLVLISFLLSACTIDAASSQTQSSFESISEDLISQNETNGPQLFNTFTYDTVPSFEAVPNSEVAVKAEEDCVDFSYSYLGTNVGPVIKIGSFDSRPKASPFKEEFKAIASKADSFSAHQTNTGNSLIHGKSFEDLCEKYVDAFLGGYGNIERWPQHGNDSMVIKHDMFYIAIRDYLQRYFEHTLYKNVEEECKTFNVFAEELGGFTLGSGAFALPDYYTDEYLAELLATLQSGKFEDYYNLFEKYGTEYVSEVFYAPKQTIYAGFSSNKGYINLNIPQYNQGIITDLISEIQIREPATTLCDLWVNHCETSYHNNFEDVGAKMLFYKTMPFATFLPYDGKYRRYSKDIEEAYLDYCEIKLQEMREAFNVVGKENKVIHDNYRIVGELNVGNDQPIKKVTIKKGLALAKTVNILNTSNMYNPNELLENGFEKIYIRPNVRLDDNHGEFTFYGEISAGSKCFKVIDNTTIHEGDNRVTTDWYQLDVKDLCDNGSSIYFFLYTGNGEVTITKCDIEIMYSK